MQFRSFSSPHKLTDYVACIWHMTEPNPHAKKGDKEKLLPTATVEMVFNLSRNFLSVYKDGTMEELTFPGAMICGVHTVPFLIDSKEDDVIFGVHFKPGGAFPFLHVNCSELLNSHFALEKFWGEAAGELRKSLIDSKDVEEKFDIMEKFLLSQFSEKKTRHSAVRKLLEVRPEEIENLNLAEFCAEIDLSQQRFIELFKREVGVSPKVYLNISRFQDVLSKMTTEERVNWLDISFDSGFFDQAHFNKEFKKLSTMSPMQYQEKKKRNPNHVPL